MARSWLHAKGGQRPISASFAGNALVVAEMRGLVAFAIAFATLWLKLKLKLKLEECYMRNQFGQVYTDYSRRVAAIVPFLL
jgi:protein-S-isoprenylcysteine O-methyltransferase Ste14